MFDDLKALIIDSFGERCEAKDTDEFNTTEGSRCPICLAWEVYDNLVKNVDDKVKEVIESSAQCCIFSPQEMAEGDWGEEAAEATRFCRERIRKQTEKN